MTLLLRVILGPSHISWLHILCRAHPHCPRLCWHLDRLFLFRENLACTLLDNLVSSETCLFLKLLFSPLSLSLSWQFLLVCLCHFPSLAFFFLVIHFCLLFFFFLLTFKSVFASLSDTWSTHLFSVLSSCFSELLSRVLTLIISAGAATKIVLFLTHSCWILRIIPIVLNTAAVYKK